MGKISVPTLGLTHANTLCRHNSILAVSQATPRHPMHLLSEHLDKLNHQQAQAVLAPSSGALQILAGPGTGKTWVMVLRVAKLIIKDKIPPESILLVTFGRHPAQELRTRLNGLLGVEMTDSLKLGTIHSTCWKHIQGHKIPNASLWGDDMCRDNIRHTIKCHVSNNVLGELLVFLVQPAVAKTKVYAGCHRSSLKHIYDSLTPKPPVSYDTFVQIMKDHQAIMKNSNALDFDDMVNEFLRLVQLQPWLVSNIQHILVDEFQDTNLSQYNLIRTISRASDSGITVVGDPDQAIYGWRFADAANFQRMRSDFPNIHTINLERNYRSTTSILNFAQAIISQDTARENRPLFTLQRPAGSLPVLEQRLTIEEEAIAVANRIQEMHHDSQGALNYGDFAILVRYNVWKANFAESLQRKGIPFQLLPKFNFYTLSVVVDVLAYIRLAFSPQTTPWLLRILENMDTIDTGTIVTIQREALVHKTTAMNIVQLMAYDNLCQADPQVRAQLQWLVVLLDYIKREGRSGTPPSEILKYIIRHTNFEENLSKREKGYGFTKRWSQVQSLLQKARQFEESEMRVLSSSKTLMSAYIEHVDKLSKEVQISDDQSVNVMTVHASKGLEFPVVFIPGVINGVYPRNVRDPVDHEEDRRLIYVGSTRAKTCLHLTHPKFEDAEITSEEAELSEFVQKIDPELYQIKE